MKKLFFLMALTAISLSIPAWGQIITVTSPAAGTAWCIGNPYTITWTKSGVMPNTVAIRLRRAGSPESELAVWNLTDSTPNNGSFGPVTVPASVPAGDYFIRVRTSSPDVIGNSATFHVSACTPAAASITVTSPNGADWTIGSTHTITWTKSGTMPHTVAIRLRRAGAPESELAVANITDSTANDGSSDPWTIANTVPTGDYFIRVRTSSPDVIGDSARFSILDPGTGSAALRSDLELAGVGVEYDGTRIVAWVRNNGPDALANRDVKFRLNFPERVGGEQILTRQLTIPVGQERSVPMVVMDASVFPDSGLRTSVSIDTGLSRINDPNRLNQHRDVRLWPAGHAPVDLAIQLYPHDVRVTRVVGGGTVTHYRYRLRATLRLRNNSPAPAEIIEVPCSWTHQYPSSLNPAQWVQAAGTTPGSIRVGPFHPGEWTTKEITIEFLIHHNWVDHDNRILFELDPEHRFNDPDRRNNQAATGAFRD